MCNSDVASTPHSVVSNSLGRVLLVSALKFWILFSKVPLFNSIGFEWKAPLRGLRIGVRAGLRWWVGLGPAMVCLGRQVRFSEKPFLPIGRTHAAPAARGD